jgi:hypothetical protein
MAKRRTSSEPQFGSDSFLDVIANLVGIVLIIIVLVAAQVRHLPQTEVADPLDEPIPQNTALIEKIPEEATKTSELEAEIARLQQRILELIHGQQTTSKELGNLEQKRQATLAKRQSLSRQTDVLTRQRENQQGRLRSVEVEREKLLTEIAELKKSIQELESRPTETKLLRYHLPVSRTVGMGELMFECRGGRVTFVDLEALLELCRKDLKKHGETLYNKWETTELAGPVGAYSIRFTVRRASDSPLDLAFSGLPPADGRAYSYGIDRWELVPVDLRRGEGESEALAVGSRFRQVVDGQSSDEVALTFFVYPDSFSLFRSLRDHLHGQGFVVVGRPLPANVPISGSRHGTLSLGQ